MQTKLIESEKGHIYETPIGVLPSVTTILKIYEGGKSGALMGWATKVMAQYLQTLANEQGNIVIKKNEALEIFKKAKSWHKTLKQESAELGSAVHNCIEVYLKGQPIKGLLESNSKIEKPFQAFLDWQKQYKFELIQAEHPTYSADGYAGTIDCVAVLNGTLYVIDFKTSNRIYEEYLMQVAAYARAYEERSGKDIFNAGILRLGKEDGIPEWREITSQEIAKHYVLFSHLLAFYKEKEGQGNELRQGVSE